MRVRKQDDTISVSYTHLDVYKRQAYIGEVVGTGIIGGMLSYPVAYLVMGNKAAALFTFVVPFLISTCGGTIIAIIITLPLKKSGMLGRMKESLEE